MNEETNEQSDSEGKKDNDNELDLIINRYEQMKEFVMQDSIAQNSVIDHVKYIDTDFAGILMCNYQSRFLCGTQA